MTARDPDLDAVVAAELRLMDRVVRHDRERAGVLIDPGFVEFGSSGTVYDRESVLDALSSDDTVAPTVEDMTATRPALDVVHLTYRTRRADRVTLRSSLWHRRDGRWRIVFHQGTPAHR
ncbi:MAG: nuclear transport factor 2 family protein [Pseudonocardia sp.]